MPDLAAVGALVLVDFAAVGAPTLKDSMTILLLFLTNALELSPVATQKRRIVPMPLPRIIILLRLLKLKRLLV